MACVAIVVQLDEYLMHVCVDISDGFATRSGSPEDDAASF